MLIISLKPKLNCYLADDKLKYISAVFIIRFVDKYILLVFNNLSTSRNKQVHNVINPLRKWELNVILVVIIAGAIIFFIASKYCYRYDQLSYLCVNLCIYIQHVCIVCTKLVKVLYRPSLALTRSNKLRFTATY